MEQSFFDIIVFMNLLAIYLKVTMEAQLGLIGGTMGLLTGFSILSGVEIIYYVVRFFLSLRISRADVVAAARSKFENHLMKKPDFN